MVPATMCRKAMVAMLCAVAACFAVLATPSARADEPVPLGQDPSGDGQSPAATGATPSTPPAGGTKSVVRQMVRGRIERELVLERLVRGRRRARPAAARRRGPREAAQPSDEARSLPTTRSRPTRQRPPTGTWSVATRRTAARHGDDARERRARRAGDLGLRHHRLLDADRRRQLLRVRPQGARPATQYSIVNGTSRRRPPCPADGQLRRAHQRLRQRLGGRVSISYPAVTVRPRRRSAEVLRLWHTCSGTRSRAWSSYVFVARSRTRRRSTRSSAAPR